MSSKEAKGQGRAEEDLMRGLPVCSQFGATPSRGGCPDPCLVPSPMSRRVRESG